MGAMTTVEESEVEEVKVEAKAYNIGDIVEAHSLNTVALNGKQGKVIGFQDERVKVQFPAEGDKALKPANLKLVEATAQVDDRKAENDSSLQTVDDGTAQTVDDRTVITKALGAHTVNDGSVQTGPDMDDESINEGLDHGKVERAVKTSASCDLTGTEELKQNVAVGNSTKGLE